MNLLQIWLVVAATILLTMIGFTIAELLGVEVPTSD